MSQETPKIRRVLIGTPTYDGKLDAIYVTSLTKTIRATPAGISISTYFVPREALVQLARNEIIGQVIEGGFDDLIFIDADMGWDPSWIFSLLAREEQVVGGTARRKADKEAYPFLLKDPNNAAPNEKGLVAVDALGAGFLRIGRKALSALWERSTPYSREGKESRAVCEVGFIDGAFYSEDGVLCRKLAKLGYQTWLDPTMTCVHIGVKEYVGDVGRFLKSVDQRD